ncbi:ABC transporter permease [Demequina sp. SYSU T00039]|uniref:Transport permease protein n=1 Tax=Demequina lignilytica TaxID=3051663 RepID=A0AAW7M4R8_9MICO|nr:MULTISPECIES: ABC transporter permease [unclassified Demequina]MDN4477884.1 ABC transporter permease [Demequina sp. SYSU T00039-1]MDN4487793.1 ABC transporter permease [Demequina sp. SYSU T00039]MDN4490824.1 ABC transporter permease [Demequina sp. SYSU T00068]
MTEVSPRPLPEGMERPGVARGLLTLVSHRYLLTLLVRKELRVRYQASVLGLAWSYVKPGAQFAVFFFVMGQFLQLSRSIPPYAIFLFSGIVVVNLFSEILGNATRSVVGNAPLVRKIFLPRQLFPLSTVLVALVHFLPQLVILVIGALVSGWRPDPAALGAALLGAVLVIVFALALGLLFGAVNVAFRDTENTVDLILMVAVWFSPVLYNIGLVRDHFGADSWLTRLYEANPLTIAVELFHRAFWYPAAEPGVRDGALIDHVMWRGVIALVVCMGLLWVGDRVFTRLSRNFAQEL